MLLRCEFRDSSDQGCGPTRTGTDLLSCALATTGHPLLAHAQFAVNGCAHALKANKQDARNANRDWETGSGA